MIRKSIRSNQLAFVVEAMNDNKYPSDLDFYESEIKGNELLFINRSFNDKRFEFEYIYNTDITENIITRDIEKAIGKKNINITIDSSLTPFRKEIVESFEYNEKDVYLLKDYKIRFIHNNKRIELRFSFTDINDGELNCDDFIMSINYKEEKLDVGYYWLMLASLSKIK